MKKVIFGIIIVIAFVGALIVFNINSEPADDRGLGVTATNSDQSPDFSLEDYDMNIVRLSDFQGQPKIINSWAVWCPFCVEELKAFAEVQKELGDQVSIIAIDRAESLKLTKRYTDDLGVTNDLIFLLDPKDSFYKAIGGFSMPETIFVDGDNKILEHKRGPLTAEQLKDKIQQHFGINN
jgi:thiol-disulfide isomerase/thioredoxin